jgi:photosystem II stability/assembly factor-like uncharacterized protein
MKKYFYIFAFVLFFTLSNNSFSQWSDAWFKGTYPIVKCFGNTVYILYTIGGGLFKSTDEGLTWKQINRKPINYAYWHPGGGLHNSSFYVSDSIMMLPCLVGPLISTDNGDNWKVMNNGIINNSQCLVSSGIGNYLLIGGNQVMYRSSNFGGNWDSVSNGLPSVYDVRSFYKYGNNLYAGVNTLTELPNGIYRTTNYGVNWLYIGPSNEPTGFYDNVYADSIFIYTGVGSFYRTSNIGLNWIVLSNGLNGETIQSVHKFGSYLFCGNRYINDSGGTYRSTNNGINWIRKINGFYPYNKNCNSFGNTNNKLFASITTAFPSPYSQKSNIFSSSNYGDSWKITDSLIQHINITSFASNVDSIFVSTLGFGVYGKQFGVDVIFAPINRDNINSNSRTLLTNGNILYAGCDSGKIFKTTNKGDNWSSVNNGMPNKNVWALIKNSSYYFAGTDGGGIYRTSDFSNWNTVNSGLTRLNIRSLFATDNYLFAGTDSGLFISSNNGSSWTTSNSGLSNLYINSINLFGTTLLAGTRNGLFKSTNLGSNWEQFTNGVPNIVVNAIGVSGQLVVIGTDSNGVYYSDNGLNFFTRSGNLGTIKAIGFTSSYIFAGGINSMIYLCSKNSINNIKKIDNQGIPSSILLYQNYPNPFNPRTTVKFSIVKNELVTLKIYDILGKEVNTLVNSKLNAGYYSVDWDGSEYSSGIYFYTIKVGDFTQVKRMVLIK